jgi:hypothetical protein
MTSAPVERTRRRRIEPWRIVRENLPIVLTAVGLLVYGSLRLSAGIFYGRFGFAPEDVGLGYAEILARSLYTLILLTIYGGLVVALALVIAGSTTFVAEALSTAGRPDVRDLGAKRDFASHVRRFFFLWPFLTMLLVLVLPIVYAAMEADTVESGHPVRQSDWIYPFAWDAPAALVGASGTEMSSRCLIYLGQADGSIALYDPADRTAWRLPTSGTVVRTGGSLTDVNRVPIDCPP